MTGSGEPMTRSGEPMTKPQVGGPAVGPNGGPGPMVLPAGNELGAGGCWSRMSPGRIYATFHPNASEGVSWCEVCRRTVYRGRPAREMVAVMRRRWPA